MTSVAIKPKDWSDKDRRIDAGHLIRSQSGLQSQALERHLVTFLESGRRHLSVGRLVLHEQPVHDRSLSRLDEHFHLRGDIRHVARDLLDRNPADRESATHPDKSAGRFGPRCSA